MWFLYFAKGPKGFKPGCFTRFGTPAASKIVFRVALGASIFCLRIFLDDSTLKLDLFSCFFSLSYQNAQFLDSSMVTIHISG